MRRSVALVALALSVGACHLALGLERADPIEGSGGAGPSCSDDVECIDQNPCTADSCSAGSCLNEPLDGEAPADQQTERDCKLAVCEQGVLGSVDDDADLPVDGKSCTDDVCTMGEPSNPPVAGGTACTDDGGQVCDEDGDCVECHSNAQCTLPETCNGGGTTGACGCTPTTTCGDLGLTCGGGGLDECDDPIACSNGMMDGTETDVDCGGPQPTQGGTCAILCEAGDDCNFGTDCVSGVCAGNLCQ